jgi:outer membrane phospholipase A
MHMKREVMIGYTNKRDGRQIREKMVRSWMRAMYRTGSKKSFKVEIREIWRK